MVETVGKKLQHARLRRQISIDDAARITRLRPAQVLDLENDNYTNFPNIAYAKGFLLIYAKFLDVDVSEFAETMETSNPVAIDEYEYLNTPLDRGRVIAYHAPPRRRSLRPLMIMGIALVGVMIVMYLIVSFQRLGNLVEIAEKREGNGAPEQQQEPPAPAARPSPAVTQPALRPENAGALPPAPGLVPEQPAPVASEENPPEMAATGATGITPPLPAPTPDAPTPPPTPVVKEVTLRPRKKTWVKIQRDMPDSAPIFEDWLYPDAPPLKIRGTKLWIQLKDRGAVEITQNGQPVSADGPTVAIE